MIDHNALKNLGFSFEVNGSGSEFDVESQEVNRLLEKYNLVLDNSFVSSLENNHLILIDYVLTLYYKQHDIPDDLKALFNHNTLFQVAVINNSRKRLQDSISCESTLFFKEIFNVINLLSCGERYPIFKSYVSYDFEALSCLFREYEHYLKRDHEDLQQFERTFACYSLLVQSFMQLCMINATDIYRKKSIQPIIDILIESNNTIKFLLSLESGYIRELNNILGQLLYYFSHIDYTYSSSDTIDGIIQIIGMKLEKQTDGYFLSKENEFGNHPDDKEKEFGRFLKNHSFLFLVLTKKLKLYLPYDEIMENKYFKPLVEKYYEQFSPLTHESRFVSFGEFEQKLLNNTIIEYKPYNLNQKPVEYLEVLEDFIESHKEFNPNNLEIIHNLLLFAPHLDEQQMISIASNLIVSPPLLNHYHQFFILKILDTIIGKLSYKEHTSHQRLFEGIAQYIENNKTGSQLLASFVKLYLSLANYYSHIGLKKTMNQAKHYYALFVHVNGLMPLKYEYSNINESILVNIGKYHKNKWHTGNQVYDKKYFYTIGKQQIKSYLIHARTQLKEEISQGISELTHQILYEQQGSNQEINDRISLFISNNLFHAIPIVSIEGLDSRVPTVDDIGYKYYKLSLLDNYNILFIFPWAYETMFRYNLKQHKTYLKENIKNVLKSYVHNRMVYTDKVTQLDNIHKLQLDLERIKTTIGFMEIDIPTVSYINDQYGYSFGNKFFKAIVRKIESLVNKTDKLYRLSGTKIGIILHNTDTHPLLIKKILGFEITIKDKVIDTAYTIALTVGKTNTILQKSSDNLEKALKKNQQVSINL